MSEQSESTDRAIDEAPVLITGMSGAGLSSAARVMEDMGWYCAHNIPGPLMLELVDLCYNQKPPMNKVALVTDVRTRDFNEFNGDLILTMEKIKKRWGNVTVIFMEARDDVLIRRFDSVRRTHPLQGSATLQVGIGRERQVLAPVKERADIVINTSELSVHDLRRTIENSFATLAKKRQHVTVQSFGFKHGAPPDADLIVDVRFLPNPYWEPELRLLRGTDRGVSDFVLSQDGAAQFVDQFVTMLTGMTDGYRREGKSFITVGVGCTGGHHRSVAVAEEIARRLKDEPGLDVSVDHRDIQRD